MGKKQLRYRVGIDAGLYSVGMAAIEIDDSSDNPYDALPIRLLSCQSVIHDGGVDPSAQKSADSRKKIAGVARRARRLNKRKRLRLKDLDVTLVNLGYPVQRAKNLIDEIKDPLIPWRARKTLLEGYIENEAQRKLNLTVAIRHIARHRGWRNPYSNVSSLAEAAKKPSSFYFEYFDRLQLWLRSEDLPCYEGVSFKEIKNKAATKKDAATEENEETKEKSYEVVRPELWDSPDCVYPTVPELITVLVSPEEKYLLPDKKYALRKRKEANSKKGATYIGKLHQSDNYYELNRIFEVQKVPNEERKAIFDKVFSQVNPKDVGAAKELVGNDQLDPTQKRASKASIEYQKYVILTTLHNLRIKDGDISRELSLEEIAKVFEFLCSDKANGKSSELDWHDVADVLGIEKNQLAGVGGTTEEGEPISVKVPPSLKSIKALKSVKGYNDKLSVVKEWWEDSSDYAREFFIESLSNSGMPNPGNDPEFQAATGAVEQLYEQLGELDESVLSELDKIKIVSGRAAYGLRTLHTLNQLMLNEGLNLHEARKKAFGIEDDWTPEGNPLGTKLGNPAADRTIAIVARWLKACEKEWGAPETVNVEHTREGFKSEKVSREIRKENDKRYDANKSVRDELYREVYGLDGTTSDSISKADVRRYLAIQRQNSQCAYCGKKIDFYTAQMDHIVPRKGPGCSNVISNLVAVCEQCNVSKSNILFYEWASKEKRSEVSGRVDTWLKDGYFSSDKQFKSYKRDVKARLNQKNEDEPLDSRSAESVAWMARELIKQIETHFSYKGKVGFSTEGNNDFVVKRVNAFNGRLTAEARRASGLERKMPWMDGDKRKTRLDRRHHAVDAAVIAMLRPSVAKTLMERQSIRDTEVVQGYYSDKMDEWKKYEGFKFADIEIYRRWRDEQMSRLIAVLAEDMRRGAVKVLYPIRLRLGIGKAHDDTIFEMAKKPLGSSWTPVAIDKVESPQIWQALTELEDYDEIKGLPVNDNRTIVVKGKRFGRDHLVGVLAQPNDIDKVESAVRMPVRGGYAGIGSTIHHSRIYKTPKYNSKGKLTGFTFESVRVFQVDLLKHRGKDLFSIELDQSSYSLRNATLNIRKALQNGEAEYLGWLVTNSIIVVDNSDSFFDPEKNKKINLIMRAFPECREFVVTGFGTNAKLTVRPAQISSENLPDYKEYWRDALGRQKNKEVNSDMESDSVEFASGEFTKEELKTLFEALEKGVPLAINALMQTSPWVVYRNTLGQTRYKSNNHMPTSWLVE